MSVGSSIVTMTALVGDVDNVPTTQVGGGQRLCEKSVYFPLNFTVNCSFKQS